ncbi:hypothetical protein ACFQ3Z_09695 [Streptomyces nogalater]
MPGGRQIPAAAYTTDRLPRTSAIARRAVRTARLGMAAAGPPPPYGTP